MELNSTSVPPSLAGIFFFALIIAVFVFIVDLLFFRSAETLISVVFYEAFALLLVGAAGWGEREHDFFTAGWKRAKTYRVDRTPRYPDFWLSVALAGLFLIFIDLYLVWQLY